MPNFKNIFHFSSKHAALDVTVILQWDAPMTVEQLNCCSIVYCCILLTLEGLFNVMIFKIKSLFKYTDLVVITLISWESQWKTMSNGVLWSHPAGVWSGVCCSNFTKPSQYYAHSGSKDATREPTWMQYFGFIFFFYNTRKWSHNVYLLYSNWVRSYKVNYNKVQQIKITNWDNTAAEMLIEAITLKKKSNKF